MARGSGISLKVAGDVVRRLASINALWLAVQNDPETTVADVAVEFYDAVGKVLEGKRLDQLEYKRINKSRAVQHHKES